MKKAQSWLFMGSAVVYFYIVNGKQTKKDIPENQPRVFTSFHMASNR
jgi:hypothetical protein